MAKHPENTKQSNSTKHVLSTAFFNKRDVKNIIFYNGENKQEVIDFFKEYSYGKFLTIREDGNLHYYLKQWQTKDETLIKPNRYLYFEYDEDDWWRIEAISKKDFERGFVSVKL